MQKKKKRKEAFIFKQHCSVNSLCTILKYTKNNSQKHGRAEYKITKYQYHQHFVSCFCRVTDSFFLVQTGSFTLMVVVACKRDVMFQQLIGLTSSARGK